MSDHADDEDEDDIPLSAADMHALQSKMATVVVPMHRGWSTPTFACHRHVPSCITACCCPCVSFGLNQRAAFGGSCIKWAIMWVLPLIALYLLIDHVSPPMDMVHKENTMDAHVGALVGRVKEKMKHAHHHGKGAAFAPPRPLPPPPPASNEDVDRPIEMSGAPSRSAMFLYSIPVAMCLVGLVGASRRAKLREKYGIGGSTLGDCVCHACCTCCSLAKETREIRHQAIEEALSGAEADLMEPAVD